MSGCETCKKNDAVWAWQPEFDSIVTLGSHYRGSTVIKICGDCQKKIRNQKAIVSEWIVLAMMLNGWKIRYHFHEYGYGRAVAGLGMPVEFMESADLIFDDYTRSKTVNIRTFRIMLRKGLLDVDRCQIAHPDHASHASVKVFYALKREQPRTTSAPARIADVVSVTLPDAAVSRVKADLPRIEDKPASLTVAPDKQAVLKAVSFGGDLTLALGLAESIKLLNEYRVNAAAHGVDWLAEQQGEVDHG